MAGGRAEFVTAGRLGAWCKRMFCLFCKIRINEDDAHAHTHTHTRAHTHTHLEQPADQLLLLLRAQVRKRFVCQSLRQFATSCTHAHTRIHTCQFCLKAVPAPVAPRLLEGEEAATPEQRHRLQRS